MGGKKSFREKLKSDGDYPKVEQIGPAMAKKWGAGTMVLPAPSEVLALMRSVRKGKLTTINHLREQLATKHGATIACPIVTGILARIVAGAAGEAEAEGQRPFAPYWRTLKAQGELNEKYPGGLSRQRALLEAEGHRVEARGKRMFVAGYEAKLAR